MIQDLKDYLRAKLDRAEQWKRASIEDETLKFYEGQIVAYRNIYKELEKEQCNIPDVVVPKGTFYCWNKDCGMEQCENICISCKKYKGNNP